LGEEKPFTWKRSKAVLVKPGAKEHLGTAVRLTSRVNPNACAEGTLNVEKEKGGYALMINDSIDRGGSLAEKKAWRSLRKGGSKKEEIITGLIKKYTH